MGQARRPVVDRDRDQPGPFQRLQHAGWSGGLDVVQLHRLTQSEQLDDGACLGGQAANPLPDEIKQPARGRQPVLQVPDPGPLHQRAGLDRGQDQFVHIQRVAAGQLPELPRRASLDRAAQRQVQQRIEVGAAEVVQVDPLQPAIPPQAGQQVRDRVAGPYGGDQEDRPLRGQVLKEGQGRGIEQRRVIGDEHQAAAAVTLLQGAAGLLQQRHRVDLPVGGRTAEAVGHQGGHRAQRQQRRGPAADHPLGRVAARRGLLTELIGQPGLAHSSSAVDQHALQLSRTQGLLE